VQHSKFFVVDGAAVYSGSQNFDWRSLTQIHELGLIIKSTAAASDFTVVFEGDWALAGGATAKKMFSRKARVRLNAAHPERATLNGAEVTYSLAFSPVGFVPKGADTEISRLTELLGMAKNTVRGQVMTYALAEHGSKRWADLDTALRKAAARGVKVELVLADWGMGGKADRDIKALSKTDNISIKISELPRLSSGFVPYSRVEHLKYMVIDGQYGYVTTSNWGPGYFLTSRGAAVIVDGAPAAAVLEDVFAKVWSGPYVHAVDPLKEYKPVKRN
jgi:phosphatidylserine/phosphatidylglycerophosphate/cardiolipin synthase-like enzyme